MSDDPTPTGAGALSEADVFRLAAEDLATSRAVLEAARAERDDIEIRALAAEADRERLRGACIQRLGDAFACRLCGHDWGNGVAENHFEDCALVRTPTTPRTAAQLVEAAREVVKQSRIPMDATTDYYLGQLSTFQRAVDALATALKDIECLS